HERRSTPLRVAGLLLLLLFLAGQGAAAAADASRDTPPSSAWVRAGARSLSARLLLPALECGPAALPPSPVEVTLCGAVVRAPSSLAPRARAPRATHRTVPLPRGPPLLA
ncbi:MAG TPA: hypothetical protein VFS20_00815, partial [Longimicrobium sp.]|nr:hypothetical protein [Longimicrobium sp.]